MADISETDPVLIKLTTAGQPVPSGSGGGGTLRDFSADRRLCLAAMALVVGTAGAAAPGCCYV